MFRILAILFSLSSPPLAWADLRPIYLKIELSSSKSIYTNSEIIPFSIKFTNTADGQRSVLLPGGAKNGQKMIFFSIFKVDENNFYTEIYREEREIKIDTASRGGEDFRYLAEQESIIVPVFVNDEVNFGKHNEAHHRFPNLPAGAYQVLAWYYPWDSYLAPYCFNKMDAFGHEDTVSYSMDRFDLPEYGTQSNYITLTIADYPIADAPWIPTEYCPINCQMCTAIDEHNWGKVQRMIDGQTAYRNKNDTHQLDSVWRKEHRNVAWLGPNSQAILASLPTWTGRNIIFRNEQGYHYYYLRWQLGIVYSSRSKFSRIFYWMGFNRSLIQTSEVDYCKLVNMTAL